jgi:inner membrane protein
MPNWKAHISITLVLYLVFVTLLNTSFNTNIAGFLILIFSSLLPDLDHPKSKIRRFVSSSFFLMVFLFLTTSLNLELIISLAISGTGYLLVRNLPLKHRGRKSLHQWKLVFLIPFFIGLSFHLIGINYLLAFFVFFGYSVHLLLDRIGFK